MMKLVLFVVGLACVFAGKPTVSFACSKPTDLLSGESVTIVPDDIKSNENVTITAKGKLSADVVSGTIHAIVKADGIPVLTKDFDLCDELKSINMTCPLKAGDDSTTLPFHIPGIPVHGNINAQAYVRTNEATPREVVCVDLKVSI
eukprot:NODE_1142_length_597_cov_242.981752_g1068_i0.p1 GENE.NODE_1142_length_597_cov_242.981752_g1068_i0~~NODE_1142_length_597_cov_242.981752_g1068_i0.p1  ORF type:complete len:146 (-),score=35.11 NODE_1142_length_597_cov_242.981752_g1068_i0:108-545(-)